MPHTVSRPARPSSRSDAHPLVPLPRGGGWVAAPLLLAAAGLCSCDDCVDAYARSVRPKLSVVRG